MTKDPLGKSSFADLHSQRNNLQAGPPSNSSVSRTRSAPVAVDNNNWRTRQLPLYSYRDITYAVEGPDKITLTPQRVYIATEDDANTWVLRLKGSIGFDIEWPFDKRTNISGPTAMVQLSDEHTILLFHVSKMPAFPTALKKLIESPDTIKTGFWIANDCGKLMHDFDVNPQACIDLVSLAKQVDLGKLQQRGCCMGINHGLTLNLMARLYLEKELAKEAGVRTSDWSRSLSEEQLEYASNDAHCGLTILKKLLGIAEEKGIVIDYEALAAEVAKDALLRRDVYKREAAGPSSGPRIVLVGGLPPQ